MISFLKSIFSRQKEVEKADGEKISFSNTRSLDSQVNFKFTYKSNTGKENIIVINGKEIKLPQTLFPTHVFPIEEFSDLLLFYVLPVSKNPEANIIAINKEGDIVWKFNEGNHLGVQHSFTQPWVDSERNLWVKNLGGKEYRIDYRIGEVLETRFENMDFDYESNEVIIGGKKIKIPDRIKKITSWHGEVLLIFYGGSENSSFGYYLAAFNNKGEQLWTITNKDLGDSFSLYDGRFIRLMASEYTYDFDPRTGEITNKIHAR